MDFWVREGIFKRSIYPEFFVFVHQVLPIRYYLFNADLISFKPISIEKHKQIQKKIPLPTQTMGLIKTSILVGGGLYAVKTIMKYCLLYPLPHEYALIIR
jgi:hypothetical protein